MISSFRCAACGDEAYVSGGADALMHSFTRTISCLEYAGGPCPRCGAPIRKAHPIALAD